MEDSFFSRRIYNKKTYEYIESKVLLLGKTKITPLNFLNFRLVSSIVLFFMVLYFVEWGYILAPILAFLYYYFAPTLILDSRIKRRKKKLEQEAIFFFEVLSLSVESGNNLYSAIELTTNSVESELSMEFQRMLNEVHIGKPFTESIESLSKRIPSDSIRNILLNIKQASIMGNDINETLKNQLNYIRETKILETRAYISKIPLKISVISVVFFIPLLLLMILGPIIIEYIG
ncbi:MAG: type II secretion system F family protein [Bacilli bacterium]|nr:type II secretion system F family protein [Bacilli bacterium]